MLVAPQPIGVAPPFMHGNCELGVHCIAQISMPAVRELGNTRGVYIDSRVGRHGLHIRKDTQPLNFMTTLPKPCGKARS